MKKIDKIKKYWDKKALEFRKKCNNEMGNTLKDENLRRLEIEAVATYLKSNINVLEIGCGNGYSTVNFAKKYNLNICGMDYSKEMVDNANTLLKNKQSSIKGRVEFMYGDVLDKDSIKDKYDVIITERCLINLGTWDNQKRAITYIKDKLESDGLFLMLEGFIDNLTKINEIRKKFNLDPIKVVWHNLFFKKSKFENFITKYFDIEKIDNFGSTYMLISRCYLHAIQKNENIFDEKLDYLASLLPNFGDYNYQQLYVLRKK